MEKIKILYVDDDVMNLRLFQVALDDKYEIFTAEDGIVGLDVMKEQQEIKAVVSDMSMPHISGVEFISEANNMFPEVIYFILTGYEISEEIMAALESGLVTKYFRKPFLMKNFDTEIKLALEKKSQY